MSFSYDELFKRIQIQFLRVIFIGQILLTLQPNFVLSMFIPLSTRKLKKIKNNIGQKFTI
jgi:hypothetical protein